MDNTKPPKRILVTAGPTREFIDPVRYVSNLSTGLMGCEIVNEAVRRGHKVSFIKGPIDICPVEGAEEINVTTARQMQEEVNKIIKEMDCLVMAAAVCDFRPETDEKQKIKKQERLTIDFVKNPDILTEITENKGLIKVGIALETENLLENAKEKLEKKGLDLIVANLKADNVEPFGEGEKNYLFIDKSGETKEFRKVEKKECAKRILDEIEKR